MPTPEEIAEALCQSGYDAFVEVKSSPLASIAAEIRYAANRMPIVIRYGSDFVDEPDSCDYELCLFLENIKRNRPESSGLHRVRDSLLSSNEKWTHFSREKLFSEFVPDDEAWSRIRRFIYINALDSTDQKALQALIAFVLAETGGFLGSDLPLV